MGKFRTPILAVDGVILEKGRILLVKRAVEPYRGLFELPGGHVEYGETVEKALRREMKEELGVRVQIKKLLGVYSDPKRDPRYHTVAVVYLLERRGKIRLSAEASEYKFFALNKLPKKIGFDHKKIISDLRKTN